MKLTVSIIGSFRRHYVAVLGAIEEFETVGIEVTSPHKSIIIDPTEEFVRFESDPPWSDNAEIQLRALGRILCADLVYVVAPGGYVGNTTCYEIGRIHERGIPLFFSEHPVDLPIPVPQASVVNASWLAHEVARLGHVPLIDTRDIDPQILQLQQEVLIHS